MRKFFTTILSVFLFFACCIGTWGRVTSKPAHAQATSNNHAVVTDEYAAIANGKKIYIFSKTVGFWQEYEHEYFVGKLQIDGNGILFFLDAQDELQTLDIVNFYQSATPKSTGITCMDFALSGEWLLYAKGQTSSTDYTQFFQTSTIEFSQGSLAYELDDSLRGLLSYQDEVYALGGGGRLYKKTTEFTQIATLRGCTEIAVLNDVILALTTDKLQTYSLSDFTAPIDEKTGSFSALTAHGKNGYVIQEGKPFAYSPTAGTLVQAGGIFALPSVHNIPTGTIKTDVESGNTAFSVATTTQSALLIEVDLKNATETLPYLSSVRGEPITALKIWQNDNHALLYYKNPETGEYQTFLVNVSQTQKLAENKLTYETARTAYATNDVGVYAYPLLALSPVETLSRGEKIQIVGEINGLDIDFYAVQKGDKIGYIPKAYTNEQSETTPTTQTETLGNEKDENGTWRLTFILLGSGAICILIDFLILRKKSENQ